VVIGQDVTGPNTRDEDRAFEEPRETTEKLIPEGHPGRLYLKADASSPKFNSPSFAVFRAFIPHLVTWLRGQLRDARPDELKQDVQKLENMNRLIFDPPAPLRRADSSPQLAKPDPEVKPPPVKRSNSSTGLTRPPK
jgi:hypothetical protein